MNKLIIMEWNINQRTRRNGKEQEIPEWIVDEIVSKEPKPHIIVLTEFYKAKNWLNIVKGLDEYNVFFTDNNMEHQNDVLIAVKKELRVKQIKDIQSTYENDNPNFLRVDIEVLHNKVISVIGVRIRTRNYGKEPKRDDFSSDKDYNEACSEWKQDFIREEKWRRKQNDIILNHVKKVETPTIIVGDFNNFRRTYVDDIWCIKEVQELYESNNYTWNHIDGSSIYNETSGFAEDHIITKELSATNQRYSRDFAMVSGREEAYPKGKDFREVNVPNPDHAILKAIIEFDEGNEMKENNSFD